MQPASSTTQQSNHGTTTTSTANTSSTNADRPPTVRTAETNQRKVTVRRDKDSSEESTEKEKNADKKSQAKPGKREAYKKAHKKGQAQYQTQRGMPRFSELQQPGYRLVHQVLVLRRQPAMHPGLSWTRLKRIGCSWKSG